MARIQNHREMPFPSVTLSLTQKGVGQDRKRICCGFLSASRQQHEEFVCRQNRADSIEKGPRDLFRSYHFSCSFNLPLWVNKPLVESFEALITFALALYLSLTLALPVLLSLFFLLRTLTLISFFCHYL